MGCACIPVSYTHLEDYFYGDVQIDKLVIANVSGGDSKEALLSGDIAAAPNISYKAAMSLKSCYGKARAL